MLCLHRNEVFIVGQGPVDQNAAKCNHDGELSLNQVVIRIRSLKRLGLFV